MSVWVTDVRVNDACSIPFVTVAFNILFSRITCFASGKNVKMWRLHPQFPTQLVFRHLFCLRWLSACVYVNVHILFLLFCPSFIVNHPTPRTAQDQPFTAVRIVPLMPVFGCYWISCSPFINSTDNIARTHTHTFEGVNISTCFIGYLLSDTSTLGCLQNPILERFNENPR